MSEELGPHIVDWVGGKKEEGVEGLPEVCVCLRITRGW